MGLRLCLVAVKRFPENTYFPEISISGKGKCFHGVWLHFKKFSEKYFLVFGKEEGKHKFRKTQATTQEKIIHDDKFSPMTAPSIAIRDCDRDRRRDRDRVINRERRRGRRTEFVVGCGLCFSEFVFSFFFSKHQKIFSGKFFEVQPNTMETFSFSGN